MISLGNGNEPRVALVTGASSGCGAAIARELASQGTLVLLVARRVALLEAMVAQIREQGGEAKALACDLTDEQAVDALCRHLRDKFPAMHLLVNNAGRDLVSTIQFTPLAKIHNLFELNVFAAIRMIQQCLPLLTQGSAIVNVASAAACSGNAGHSAYAASKAACVSLTRSLARELSSRGIRVNAVAPGVVRTELTEQMLRKLGPEQTQALEKKHPLGFGDPQDVADAVAFLGGPQARWITGQTLVVDGGLTA